jgi:hypothetical protein
MICGCGSPGSVILDTLDPVTGITISHATVPLVFYRDRSARAAYARDYVNLGPLQVNRMGRRQYFLWAAVWSTLQNTHLANEQDGFETIIVFADGEPLELSSAGWTPQAIGASESVYVKPVASAAEAYYEVTVDQLRLIAEATDIRLKTIGAQTRDYEPWDSQSAARGNMQAFLEYVSF